MKSRILETGPGHVDAGGSHWAADAHVDLDRVSSDGDTVAVLHIGLTNVETGAAEAVEAVGVELTRGDLWFLGDALLRLHKETFTETLVLDSTGPMTEWIDLGGEA